MLALYMHHYPARYRVIAGLIPDGSSVLDVCCGPAILYSRYLRPKAIEYTGLDMSSTFINRVIRKGGRGYVWDVRSDTPLPRAEYVIMQGSLYHFLPEPAPLINRMLAAATRQVIIAEPVRNLTSSTFPPLAAIARRLTKTDDGVPHRFTEQTFDEFFEAFSPRVTSTFSLPGGREKVVALAK